MGLGEKLRDAMEKLRNARHLDKDLVKEAVKELQRALIASDVEVSFVLETTKKIEQASFEKLPEGIKRREHILKVTHDQLSALMGGQHSPPETPKKILLVGLFGSGKTTTVGKLANYYQKRGQKVGVIAADVYRPAAYEQLEQIAKKVNAKFFGIKKEKNAAKVVQEGLKQYQNEKVDLIICDSAGRDALDAELTKEIKGVNDALKADEKWLVLGADIGQLAKKQATAFHDAVGVNGVIITRMDGSAKGGGALAACAATKSPVYFIGTGEKANDLEEFDATRFLSRIMGYGDLHGLLEKVKEAEIQEMDVESLMQGEFNLDIFYQQLTATRKMGPLNKVMDMMGLSAQIPKEQLEMTEEKLNDFKYMIDSMTKNEKQDPEKQLSKSRIERIAKGSGKKEEDDRELIKQYKQMKKVFKRMKKLGNVQDFGDKKIQKLLGGFGKRKKMKLK